MAGVYYQDDHVTLYHGDCLEETAWLQADVLITDPPYGIAGALSSGWKGKKPPGWKPVHDRNVAWDKTLDARDAALVLWGTDKPALVFGTAKRLDAAPAFREVPLIWDKGDAIGMGDVDFPWRPNYELIFVSGPGWSGKRTSSILRYPMHTQMAKQAGHPTPKPLALMSELVDKAPLGVIADPFAGSGSTLVAARNLGRRVVGVELDERYCEIAARRLSQGAFDFGDLA